ncbi:MAG: four helix bundle protein [Desulfobulbaceae bacterium]|nr:four helix bundle protein [Desulfobulbaceae bacterium]
MKPRGNREFAQALELRTRKFAVWVIRLSDMLPNTPEGKVLRNQLTKSGTSIGANYREVNRSRIRAELNNRSKICGSEASETQYWLEVIRDANLFPSEALRADLQECTELRAIFTAIVNLKEANAIVTTATYNL